MKKKPIDRDLYNIPHPPRPEVDLSPFTEDQVLKKLRKCENSAPGDDRLTFRHWLDVDPEAKALTLIFNTCLKYGKIPFAWKKSKTILIYKKGDPMDVGNWRPIAISRTIYRLYTALLAERLTNWMIQNNVLHKSQKGFLPHDGVFEHNYLLQRSIDNALNAGEDICVGLLDVAGAFPGVPHEALTESLQSEGAGDKITEIVTDIYTDATTSFITAEGETDEVNIEAGIKQGCAMSGGLFNLAINPIVKRVQDDSQQQQQPEGAETHKNPAADTHENPATDDAAAINTAPTDPKKTGTTYADDLGLIDPTPEGLQARISLADELMRKISLKLKPEKSFSIHLSGKKPAGTRPTKFFIGDQPLNRLRDGQFTEFLGKPVGFHVVTNQNDVEQHINFATHILTSKLAPWQRIDALKTFFYPSLTFAMRTGQLQKKDWDRIDETLRPMIKATLYLPISATNNYLYGSTLTGSIGLPLTAEDSDIFLVDNAYKLLTSKDPTIVELATSHLFQTVSARLRRNVNSVDVSDFMSNVQEGEFHRQRASQRKNAWTRARAASGHIGVKWDFTEEYPTVDKDHITVTANKRRALTKLFRAQLRKERDLQLHAMKNQGKVMQCVSLDKVSSHFVKDGSFTRFADWRFIHRARLNQVPLKGAQMWRREGDRSCRRCGYELETLPHVLDHCPPHNPHYLHRHNEIVARIKKAASYRFEILGENQVVDDGGSRPDLVLVNRKEKKAMIFDVAIPFDNQPEAFKAAREEKETKYEPVLQSLRRKFPNISIAPIIIGALGSWDPENDVHLRQLCSRSYAKLMKKLCVSDVVKWGRDIYIEHLTGVRQAHPID
jgi:hypothetical protein